MKYTQGNVLYRDIILIMVMKVIKYFEGLKNNVNNKVRITILIIYYFLQAEGMIAEKERITDKNKLEKAKPKSKGGPGGGVSVFVTNVKNKMPFSMV